jgi:hypothetical protein
LFKMTSCFPSAVAAAFRIVAAGLAALSILGCASDARALTNPEQPVDSGVPARATQQPPDIDLSSALLYQIMAAEVALQRGDAGSAFATYLSVARQTRDARIASRAKRVRPTPCCWREVAGSRMPSRSLQRCCAKRSNRQRSLPSSSAR